ncbi:MAG: phospho-N-acetylmuramoyl-pentapeptide-transferase [Lachnospiraceae bacterium]|nr:phospho-N-acetylmuramoyl-pentapeptide-transferase [Lachnospiraceae bacterium]
MKFSYFLGIVISFAISAVLCPLFIPVLHKLKFGQQVREEGNPEHLKKQGTPTMGGIAFLIAVIVTGGFSAILYPELLPTLLLTIGFALTGFIDDYIKVVRKHSEGFKPWQKLLCQILITGGFAVYCYLNPNIGSSVILPFTGGKEWNMGWLFIPFVFACVLGTDNGTNFTDGLDGLCSSVTIVVSLFFFLAAIRLSHDGMAMLSGIFAGALMGFLLVNAYPAKMFMGDTGSLAIGGFVAGTAITLKMGWFILLIGLIYLVEVISVIMQVGYFKLTHGKRIFKMAPIHHHFELSGFSETRIVAMFSIITVLLGFVSWLAM